VTFDRAQTIQAATVPVYGYRIINTYPHDPGAFTQGLLFSDGRLYESTGLYGQSTLREVDLTTGRILQSYALPPAYFGEGITLFRDEIIQLTWQSGRGFVYDRDNLALRRQFSLAGEGWGLTHDGQRLILSDGSATLRFLDPDTFAPLGRLQVYDEHGPVRRLNELEYIAGEIYANVWQTDHIARIDPTSGQVTGWIDLAGLLGPTGEPVDVLNGIAYDPATGHLFVTGKLWPRLFKIELIPLTGTEAEESDAFAE
jgi:glutamine cyclotransferase